MAHRFIRRTARLPLLLALLLLLLLALDPRLIVRTYRIQAEEIQEPIRIALVTDLHSCRYGKEQKNLLAAIDKQAPDVILLGGDIFDDVKGDGNTEHFLSGIAGKYPCFYVTGNHEYWSGETAFAAKMAILDRYNIPVLAGDCVPFSVRGETINLCGVDDPDADRLKNNLVPFTEQLSRAKTGADEHFTVLLTHRPEYFAEYAALGFDLVLCGHAHGGQWRIPYLQGGLFAPNQGFLPRYAGGEYTSGETTMIVSRGLARETTIVPRIFNRPELVIVELGGTE